MKHNHPILYLLALTLAVPFLVSCEKAAKDTTAEDIQAVKAASERWVDAFNQGDAAAIAGLYTEEAKLLPPNSSIVVGREGIQAVLQGFFDAGAGDYQSTDLELSVSGDMAYVVGKQTVTIQPEEGEAISDSGKYVVILKREKGSWKIDIAIWNSSLPLPVPEALPTAEEEE